jgi:hypothetical protein
LVRSCILSKAVQLRPGQSCYIVPNRRGGHIFKLTTLALIAAIPALASAVAQDPRLGAWTIVSAQATMDPPNKLSITALPNGLQHVVMSGDIHLDFTAKADGQQSPVPGNPGFNQVVLRHIGRRQVEVTEKKDGTVVATLRNKLSNNGNELTITTTRQAHPDQVTVWTRGPAPKDAHHPLAGDWTEDLTKTLERQTAPIKFDPDPSGAVHFTGDSTYTARFDGKKYDVQNSPNDTVELQLADPHTVNALYRRDNQVTQKETWSVAPNGQTMTLNSTATLETGQHITEKLVFKKQ